MIKNKVVFYNYVAGNIKQAMIKTEKDKINRIISQGCRKHVVIDVAIMMIGFLENFDFEEIQNIIDSDHTSFCWIAIEKEKRYIKVKNRAGKIYKLKKSDLGNPFEQMKKKNIW